MAEAAAAPPEAPEVKHERTVYGASGGHKFVFSILFLLLLPFFTSLWPMFFMRLKAGLVGDAMGHAIMAIAFSILMFLILIELIFSLRARIVLGEKELHLTLPSGRGPTPMLRYRSYDIPYDQIQTVETRREIYGGSMVPVMLKGARIITKGNETIPLGYVSEANLDPAFPYPEIAAKIAERARLPLIDRGSVWRSVRRKFLGWPKRGLINTDTVDETQIAALNASHKNMVGGLIGILAVLIAIGIVGDLSSDQPIGQTASTIVETTPAKPAPAKPKKPAN
jgi:hypothetical protein